MSSEPEAGSEPAGADEAPGERRRCDVLVLGASFGGVEVLLQLQRRLPRPLKVVVVDRQRTHGYIPLAHERLCARIGPGAALDTEAFVRSLPGVEFVHDE
ncbi:MAG: hypothetical protein KDK70_33740, partial [Myxococcales bacterium]|nr:hypothetical protein [Myxococcales bacterium]